MTVQLRRSPVRVGMKLKPSYRICTLFLSHRLNSPFVAEVGDAEA